jgi:HEAT repeat protein
MRLIGLGVLFAVLASVLEAQTNPGISTERGSDGNPEMTIEQSYLPETVELIIIREQSRSNSREAKLIALEYITAAINRGSKSDEIRSSLEYLALEGVVNVARENGRVVNNFPDIRKQAAASLGQLGTPEAKTTLLKMVSSDNDPLVTAEALKSLGRIGNISNDEVILIARAVNRFHNFNPDNMVVLSALDIFEKAAAANNGIWDRFVVEIITRVSESHFYVTSVRNRAKQLLGDLRKYRLNQG